MGLFSRLRRRKAPYAAVGDEEQIARYVHLLNTLPASVVESAHAAAFKDLPVQQRREMFDQLRPFLADADREAAPDDPHVLAKLVRRAEQRRAERASSGGAAGAGPDAEAEEAVRARTATADEGYVDPRTVMMQTGVMALVAYQFMTTSAVTAYFTVGAGSLGIADEPGWVGDTFDPGSAGIDAGGGGFDGGGGGFDGGGFGGGFDAGGFGGGMDAGGFG